MDDKRKAYHEAGHGAVAIHEGIGIEFITIRDIWANGRLNLGLCKWDDSVVQQRKHLERTDPKAYWLLTDKLAAFMYGGMEAEIRYYKERGLPPLTGVPEEWDGDLLWIEGYAQSRISEEAGRKQLRATISQYVSELFGQEGIWGGVARMAETLIRVGTISGDQARELYLGSSVS